MEITELTEADVARFHSKYDKSDGCWTWQGGRNRGYGAFWVKSQNRSAHIVSYLIHKGSIPDGMCVCHRCDVRECVRPDHLFLGTHRDNINDAVAKSRHSHGEEHPHAKLTEDAVRDIRSSTENVSALSRRYGVERHAIRSARDGRTWKHVTS